MTEEKEVQDKGTIISIEELDNFQTGSFTELHGSKGARLGLSSMFNVLGGNQSMEGYKIKTDKHEYLLLISNEQSCCESWGYFSTNDNLQEFVGATLLTTEATDTALTTEKIDEIEYLDEGGVQFVTFKTDKGDFQIAVYNAHNGYYGHSVFFVEDSVILLSDTL